MRANDLQLRHRSRGATLHAVLVALAIIGGMGLAVTFVRPSGLTAAHRAAPDPIPARVEAHQQIIEAIGALIGHSAEVLAVHQRGDRPYLEVVLRLHAALPQSLPPEPPRPEEIAVLTHSRILQTLTLCTLAPVDAQDEAEGGQAPPQSEGLTADLRDRAFCERWRSHPLVQRRLIGAGLSEMIVQEVAPGPRGSTLLYIQLTWSADSADGKDEASVLVNARLREAGDR